MHQPGIVKALLLLLHPSRHRLMKITGGGMDGQITRLIERHPIVPTRDLGRPATSGWFRRRNTPKRNLIAGMKTLGRGRLGAVKFDITAQNKPLQSAATEPPDLTAQKLIKAHPRLVAIDNKPNRYRARLPFGCLRLLRHCPPSKQAAY